MSVDKTIPAVTLSQWRQLWHTLGADNKFDSPNTLYGQLIACYNEDHRHYHTLYHLAECLEKLVELQDHTNKPAEIELALWFHDAIYDPCRNDNEELSAKWAYASVLSAGLDDEIAEHINKLIMVTQHQMLPVAMDEKILVDCDLAILAAAPRRFQEYEQQIREEYSFVSGHIFRTKRKAILQHFLTRSSIFNTPHFIKRYEKSARSNLRKALENYDNSY